jgi:alkanesulfonate monooxygenase SsuD/methylene tetrahydromethanopterin reductase-like flavin-dependent oxidoreductase (luciferase family)
MSAVQFGLSLSTSAAAGEDPVAVARRAEELGFDFVSVSDHPGGTHPTYETWTLLTWLAAATSRIGIAAKVLCGPLRNPALTAKMAETLQRLSNGRLILGLGGGYSDEEMGSFGIPPRSAREKVDGLEESLHIMQGLWTQPAFSFAGRIYSTARAEIEPKPERPIPVWLGTFGDRALDVTGRLANGWIPSYGFAPPEVVTTMRAKVLTAAERTGRDPADITCAYSMEVHVGARLQDSTILSGTADEVVNQLVELVGLGFTAMNLSPTGPDTRQQMELIAGEVMAAVRSAG